MLKELPYLFLKKAQKGRLFCGRWYRWYDHLCVNNRHLVVHTCCCLSLPCVALHKPLGSHLKYLWVMI